MKARHAWWMGLALLVHILPGSARAQFVSLAGVVRSAEGPLVGVRVEALRRGEPHGQALTNAEGRYRMQVAPGAYVMSARFPGFAARRIDSVQVSSGAPVTLDIELTRVPVALDVIMVTAGRRQETVNDAASSVAVVEEQVIRERVALSPLDLAASTPGVDLAVQGLLGRQLVARGFNGTLGGSLLMLTDFRNSALPLPRANLAYFLAHSSDDLERVEVVRGPSSALYGPNAADGVVHFVTKSPLDAQGGSVNLTMGSRSVIDRSARYAVRVNDRFAVKVSGAWFKGREWAAPRTPAGTAPGNPFVERAGAEARADVRLSPSTTAILTLGTGKAMSAVEYTSFGGFALRGKRSDFAQVRLNNGRLFAQAHWRGNPGTGEGTNLGSGLVTRDHSQVLTAQVQHAIDLGSRTLMQYGADVQRTDPQTLGTVSGRFEDDDRSLEFGAFVQATTRLSSTLRLLSAARVDRHDRLDGPVFSPRLGMTWTPTSGRTWRASYNRAFATPTSTQLTADIVAARLDPLPFNLRGVGVPRGGYRFSRACGGLCFSSPFSPGQALPLDATRLWPVVVQLLRASGVDISAIPAPGRADVATSLRSLDLGSGGFRTVPADLKDLPSLQPTITNAFEVGYRGLVGSRAVLDASIYASQRQDFLASNVIVTPNVFLSTASLAQYLGRFMPPQTAAGLAAGIGGIDGDAKAPGIPLGTVGPEGKLAGSDILLAATNVGDVRFWGTDLSLEVAASDHLTLWGSWSFLNKQLFAGQGLDGSDVSSNTPRHKMQASARYRRPARDFSAEARVRSIGAFRMIDGVLVGNVDGFTVADLEVGILLPGVTRARITGTIQNVADKRHTEFVGHPVLGRLLLTRVRYQF